MKATARVLNNTASDQIYRRIGLFILRQQGMRYSAGIDVVMWPWH